MSELSNGPRPNASTRLHLIGPFRARLVSAHHTAHLDAPERLRASLLTQGANPLGLGHIECPRAAAAQRPVRLQRIDSRTLVIPHQFAFHLPGSALIQQLGLFDDEGRLRFFGQLSSSRQGVERPEDFHFPATTVEVMHSRPAGLHPVF